MKLTLMLWTAAAAAAVTVQLLAAASLETEEKELEDALATREVEVEKRDRQWEDQQMALLNVIGKTFQTVLRLAKRLSRRGRRDRVYEYKVNSNYDEMPYKRNLKEREEEQLYNDIPFKRLLEGQGDDAKESVSEQDAVALCREFLNSHKIGEAAGKAKAESQEQVEGKQEESDEEGDVKDLLQTQQMLSLCLELMP